MNLKSVLLLKDDFVGHIVENDVTIHGLTVRMEQLMDKNKDFTVVYGAKVTSLLFFVIIFVVIVCCYCLYRYCFLLLPLLLVELLLL